MHREEQFYNRKPKNKENTLQSHQQTKIKEDTRIMYSKTIEKTPKYSKTERAVCNP